MPNGEFTKAVAKSASTGASTVPNGRPVAGSMSMRRIIFPSALV
jgi:hypothetical protein